MSGHRSSGVVVDGTEKAAFSVLADSYEPTQVILSDAAPGEQDIVVLHDRPEKADLTVEWDCNGDREQAEHTVGPFARVTVDTLTLSAGDDVTLAATDGQTVVKNALGDIARETGDASDCPSTVGDGWPVQTHR